MAASTAICARCGHVFSDWDALDPCPECGETERALRREELVVDRSQSARTEVHHQVEELRPDGSHEIVRDPIEAEHEHAG
jgi:predicted  nucleic acid-binding Zn-ribbon protein